MIKASASSVLKVKANRFSSTSQASKKQLASLKLVTSSFLKWPRTLKVASKHVLLEGVSLSNSGNSKRIITEPVKKDALDYFAYFALVVLLAISLGLFIKTGAPESALVPGAIFLLVMFFISSRKKQPANKLFSCSKCRAVSSHDERTVLAWNRGLNRLYCKSCHQAWLREQPKEQQESRSSYSSSNSGCLGLFLVIASAPIICVVGAATWFV